RDGCRLGLDAEIREYVLHGGLIDQQLSECRAMGSVVSRLRDSVAHSRGRADDAVEARVIDHLDDRPDPAPLLPDQLRPGAAELDLAGGIRAIAELVLQPLEEKLVAGSVRKDAREQEARQPCF